LESIVKTIGSKVKVVRGKLAGHMGVLFKKNKKKKTVLVQFEETEEKIKEFKLNYICEYV
jgi:ribosomal protein L24